MVPLFIGKDASISNSGYHSFTNLTLITGGATVNPRPDFFDGACLDDVNEKVRQALDKIIIPSKEKGVPIAPTFFLEFN